MNGSQPTRFFADRIALDLKLFDTLAADNGHPKSVAELAAPCNASPKLVKRVLRHLAATNMILQTGDEEYAQNQMSRYLEQPKYREGMCHMQADPSQSGRIVIADELVFGIQF